MWSVKTCLSTVWVEKEGGSNHSFLPQKCEPRLTTGWVIFTQVRWRILLGGVTYDIRSFWVSQCVNSTTTTRYRILFCMSTNLEILTSYRQSEPSIFLTHMYCMSSNTVGQVYVSFWCIYGQYQVYIADHQNRVSRGLSLEFHRSNSLHYNR